MKKMPNHFKSAQIDIDVIGFGRLGRVFGYLCHYPAWYGIFIPDDGFHEWKDRILECLEYNSVDLVLTDLEKNMTWNGTSGTITFPHSEYPWYEIVWTDERDYKEVLGLKDASIRMRIRGWIEQLLSKK